MKYGLHVILTFLLLLGAGCAAGSVPATERYFGETAYEQTLDKFLADYKDQEVRASVRLKDDATAAQVKSLMDKENSPEITEVTPVSPDGVISGGNVPFSGEVTDDSLNEAIGNYATTRLGGDVKEEILARISSEGTFLIVSFRATGRADAIREWWHANTDMIAAVTVEEEL